MVSPAMRLTGVWVEPATTSAGPKWKAAFMSPTGGRVIHQVLKGATDKQHAQAIAEALITQEEAA